ncbi:acetyl-CoA carboxylase biotin carboxyl carrier protein [Vallitalea maricola]|uniref:Acetyl-CoA carboxylase biotin carboxyl carrier protein n=1 Tax=Vallitalea maricola TaxID=3074433 RepID=A0ACB5URU6_9FIRM|nr:acetyl-CoA carboxylase biotin carboxyl carrier protein [Vallitalea sp. AN17-2]
MKFENIKELINLVSEKGLTRVDIEKDGCKISIRKEKEVLMTSNSEPYIQKPNTSQTVNVNKETVQENNNQKVDIEDENTVTIKSPIVGTFYSAPSPDEDDYVKVGDKVSKGKTLCIIEAMKLMNDIEAEVSGEVVDILVENEEIVEYNQPLFKIRP